MSNEKGKQPLVCKKCGKGGFYYPVEGADIGAWQRLDKFGNVQAFESPFDVPHWYICPIDERGKDHRKKMEEEFTNYQKQELLQREEANNAKKRPLPEGQLRLPAEKLTDIDRSIAEKINVIELILEDIKRLLAQKAE